MIKTTTSVIKQSVSSKKSQPHNQNLKSTHKTNYIQQNHPISIQRQIKKQLNQNINIHSNHKPQSHHNNQSNHNNLVSNHNNINHSKNQYNPKVSDILNGPTQKAFLKYYQENIKLKKQNQQKNTEIHDLKKKLQQMMNLNKTTNNPYAQLQQLKDQVKKQSVPRAQSSKGKSFYNTMKGNGQTKKVQNLLQIIQHYKQKLLVSQQQSAHLRRQKLLLQQDLQVKSKQGKSSHIDQSLMQQNIAKQDQLIRRLKQKTTQFELQNQRNKYLQAQLRRLQNKIKTIQIDTDRVQQLKVQNRVLQQKIMRLTLLSDNTQTYDRRTLQDKNRQLEIKLKSGIQKYTKIKDQKMKLQVDLTLIKNKLIQLQHQLQQTQKQNLTLKKNQINDPVIQKLIKNKQLLAQVIGQIQRPKHQSQIPTFNKYQTTQKLLLQKQALAKQLIDIKNKLKNMEEAWKQKQTMIKIQKQQMLAQLHMMPVADKNARYTSKQGVQYDGDISTFSDQNIGNPKGVNFFDIYLGQLNLIESLVRNVTSISSINNPLIMATVDFYNFQTKHTRTTQGLNTNLNTQFVFRVSEDQFFYRFMSKQSFKISIWASQGNIQHLLGEVQVPLKQLMLKNKPNIAPVINTSSPIIKSQKVVGTIHFDMRMRFPIYQKVSHILHEPVSSIQKQQNAPKRKLIIQIQQGYDFSSTANLFVYYPFRSEDYYSKTSKGPQPKWGHYKMIDITYNQQFKNYLRKNEIQFTVFDDNAVLYDGKDNDVIGSCSLSLLSLVDSTSSQNPIRQKLQIKKNGMKFGYIEVKVFWYQSKQKLQRKQQKKKQELMDTFHSDVLKYIRDIGSTAQSQFRVVDKNGTGMVNYDEFLMWISKVKKTYNYSQQFISKYYDTFHQPLNLMSWVNRLQQKTEQQKRQQDLMPQLGMINQMLRKNSVKITKQVTLRQYLKDKQLFNQALNIDQDRNGMISKQQLLKYMKSHNIQFDENKLKSDKIKLIDFLNQYSN